MACTIVSSIGRAGEPCLPTPGTRALPPDQSGSGQHRRRNGRIVPSAERRLQGISLPDHLCDPPGHGFAPKARVYTTVGLRDRQAARGREDEAGGLRPMIWGWNVDED